MGPAGILALNQCYYHLINPQADPLLSTSTLARGVNDFQANEDQELKEDLRLAERVAPFFCKFVVSSMLTHFIFEVEEPDQRRDRYHRMSGAEFHGKEEG